jgi:hypothetical protein
VRRESRPCGNGGSSESVLPSFWLGPSELAGGGSRRRRSAKHTNLFLGPGVGGPYRANARLRKALYLPALTAICFNPLLKALFERLVAAGKAKMAAVGACMRKLVMIAYGVLKHRKPFDPSWALKMAP